MGGYQSKVATPPTQQKFSAQEGTPARVHFSPELIKQLHREQEVRVQHRPVAPQVAVIVEEPEMVQLERHARIEHERHQLAIKEAERKASRELEVAAAQKARAVLERLEKQPIQKGNDAQNVCAEEAKRLTSMLSSNHLDKVFEELKLFETCVKRESRARGQSLL